MGKTVHYIYKEKCLKSENKHLETPPQKIKQNIKRILKLTKVAMLLCENVAYIFTHRPIDNPNFVRNKIMIHTESE